MAHTYKIGDMVVPKIGPHKGHPHTVIHVHGSGEVNIKPHGLRAQQNKYRMGAAMAKPEHLAPHTMKESTTCPDCGCETCRCKLKMHEDHIKVGDRVHAGFGAKGGAGHRGVVKNIDGNRHVHIELDKDAYEKFGPRTIIAPHHHVTKESVDEDYTAMKGKESFMKKKPLDVKYDPRWHVMSHGKTMERPTKEDAEQKPTEKPKKKFDYKKFAEYRRTHPEKFIAGVKEEVEQIDELSKGTLERYQQKAAADAAHHATQAASDYAEASRRKLMSKRQSDELHPLLGSKGEIHRGLASDALKRAVKRDKGIETAEIKLGKKRIREAIIQVPMERPTKEELEPSEREKLKHACWKGYEAIGVKTKDGVKVPNCVPVQEQTPAGGFGPDTAGTMSGGDVSTKTVSGPDSTSNGTRKKEILRGALKSARDKQKRGKPKEFEKDPEYSPLVVTQQ